MLCTHTHTHTEGFKLYAYLGRERLVEVIEIMTVVIR